MTDETTARDRAESIVTEQFEQAGLYYRGGVVTMVVAALQAHPEVLRALAGAPTADVTDEQDDPWYCPTCDELTRSCPHLPDGMDLEAQGEMADQLAAVQAELRTECAAKKYGLWTGHVWTDDEPAARKWLRERPDPRGYELFRREVRTTAWRALDGDTTEEA